MHYEKLTGLKLVEAWPLNTRVIPAS